MDNPDRPGRGEWYNPNGTLVPPPGGGAGFYRTRGHMVIRLNRVDGDRSGLRASGTYRCEIPGAGGITITRKIVLTKGDLFVNVHVLELIGK